MVNIIIGALFTVLGAAFIGSAVYNRFIRSYYPDPKRWIRVRVKNGPGISYSEQTISKYGSGVKYGTEYPVTYTVNGRCYNAFTSEKCTHIFCSRKDPKYFKEPEYFRSEKRTWKKNSVLIFSIFMGVGLILSGIGLILM